MSAFFSLLSFHFFFFPFSFCEKRRELSSKEKREQVKYLIISEISVDLDF